MSAKGLTVKLTEDPLGNEILSPDVLLMFPGEDTDSQYELQKLPLTIKR